LQILVGSREKIVPKDTDQCTGSLRVGRLKLSYGPPEEPMRLASTFRGLAGATSLLLALAADLAAQATPASPRTARESRSLEDRGFSRLQSELERLALIARGTVGVGIIHLESGQEFYLNGDEPFPMASTYKVPIALTLFDLVDQGRLRLDSMITLGPADLRPGSGQIARLLDDPGVSLSLLNLTELMLLISDNSATDLVLDAVGGAPAVNARLAALGVTGISVDRPTVTLIADAIGVKELSLDADWTLARFDTLARGISDSARAAARVSFYQDLRDTATPRGMAQLFAKLWRQQALTPASTARLLDMLFRVETGLQRIKGMLPPGIRVAHKTGTLGIGVTNDAGIVELPGDAGHVVLVVFIKESAAPAATQEQAIAQISRAVYDYFVLVGPESR
jgi:beta-lactamase class A